MSKVRLLLAVACCLACRTGAPDVGELFQQTTGVVQLPPGVVEVSREIKIPEGARDLEVSGASEGTVLRAADDFQGRAVIHMKSVSHVRLRRFTIDGNRSALAKPVGLPPSDVAFVDFYRNNGLIAEDATGLEVSNVEFINIANFAVLIARSKDVTLDAIRVADSGSTNERGRNNTTGGILLEEGTSDFTVRNSLFRNIRGNGVWTHSRYGSPRNHDGVISGNWFYNLARDAIQVGHATRVRVLENNGERIGYPVPEVDVEGGGTPVAIDTAGNVDHSVYGENYFEEVNGKCIDLDGFHDGEVRRNGCVNHLDAGQYPFGHYGIVMNNANPDMESRNIAVEDNYIDGMKYGGIFVIGSGHRIVGNRLLHLNKARCGDKADEPGCSYFPGEPDLLRSGIYLGRGAERPALATGNLVENNEITGYKMSTRCIGLAPGVPRSANRIRNNICRDAPEAR